MSNTPTQPRKTVPPHRHPDRPPADPQPWRRWVWDRVHKHWHPSDWW